MNEAVNGRSLFKIGDNVQIRIPVHKCVTVKYELARANYMIGNIADIVHRPDSTYVYTVVLRNNSVLHDIPEGYIGRLRDCTGTVAISSKLPDSAFAISTECCRSDSADSITSSIIGYSYIPQTISSSSVATAESKIYTNTYFKQKFMPKKIIYNDPATIVFWNDGTKTVVKRSPSEQFNKYNAFCAALAKKIFENNSQVNKIVQSGIMQKPDKTIVKESVKHTMSTMCKMVAEMKAAERTIKMQRIMELKKKHHLSYAEIAKRMDIPEITVRNLVKEMKEQNKDG